MDFISPLFGSQGIQFANGEDAKKRMNAFNYFLRKDAIEEYCSIFEKVHTYIHVYILLFGDDIVTKLLIF